MSKLGGTCDARFSRVYEAFVTNIDAGKEVGASIYVNVDGDDVVDLWGGWCDRDRTAPWREDTVVNVFSASKMVTSLAVLLLVDRGQIDIYAPVAKYWPEFAQNGKARVEVRHLMSHTSGVSGWEQPFRFEDAFDISTSTAKLAAQAPWWEPGTLATYHASTFGHLNAELVRRVTGNTLREFIASEIAGPLAADFYLRVGAADFARVAIIYPVEESRGAPQLGASHTPTAGEIISAKTRAGSFSRTMGDPFTVFNSPEWRASEFGGSGGHANARGIGRIMSAC